MTDNSITPMGDGKWLVQTERKRNGHTATAQVLVQNTAAPADTSTHAGLAGARAWLTLAQGRYAANDYGPAIECARAGVSELGSRYSSVALEVTEDTSLRIDMAEDLLEHSRPAEAARMLIDALETRLGLYIKLHAKTIAQ